MKSLAAVLLWLFSAMALATIPLQASLEELASKADHIFSGHVTGVEMIDGQGKAVNDRNAKTGPGLQHTILLIVKLDAVFFSRAKVVPEIIRVPLDPLMHFSFGQIESAHSTPSGTFLLILKGDSFQPILHGVFARPMSDKERALEIREKAQGP
jgi:hypothetical protein